MKVTIKAYCGLLTTGFIIAIVGGVYMPDSIDSIFINTNPLWIAAIILGSMLMGVAMGSEIEGR